MSTILVHRLSNLSHGKPKLLLSSTQLRMARAALGWSVADAASKSGVSQSTIKRMESGDGVANVLTSNMDALRSALEEAGITFLAPGELADGGYGVRLTKKPVSLFKVRKLSNEELMEREHREKLAEDEADEQYRNAHFKKYGRYPDDDE